MLQISTLTLNSTVVWQWLKLIIGPLIIRYGLPSPDDSVCEPKDATRSLDGEAEETTRKMRKRMGVWRIEYIRTAPIWNLVFYHFFCHMRKLVCQAKIHWLTPSHWQLFHMPKVGFKPRQWGCSKSGVCSQYPKHYTCPLPPPPPPPPPTLTGIQCSEWRQASGVTDHHEQQYQSCPHLSRVSPTLPLSTLVALDCHAPFLRCEWQATKLPRLNLEAPLTWLSFTGILPLIHGLALILWKCCFN